ncbi:extensin-like [Ischnura elegans]|uniref:extensin-like n=1 Tax=Ischnura elegans TaxID=197161 RepID=UPI001ED878E9|nr:extensin-like [Ischnura elegans]
MCKPIAQVAACGARTESSISQAPSYWGLTQDIARGHAFMDELMTMFEEDAALDLSSGDSISTPPPLIPISEMNRPRAPQPATTSPRPQPATTPPRPQPATKSPRPQPATTPPRPQPASRPHSSSLPAASPSRPAAQPSSSPPRASPYSLPPETQPLTPPPASSPALESPMSPPHEERCSPSPEPRSPSIVVLDSQWSTEEETQWPSTSCAGSQVRQSSSIWARFESATPSPPPYFITCPKRGPVCDDDVCSKKGA